MDITTLLNFLLATAIVVIIPGPNIILIVNDSINYGYKSSIFTVFGISAGMALLFSLSLMGVTTIFIIFPWLFEIIRFIGALYLLYLGTSVLKSAFDKNNYNEEKVLEQRNNLFTKGFLVSASNPKGLFFAGAFFPQFLNKDGNLLFQSLILCGGCLFVSTLIGIFYAFMAKKFKYWLKSKKINRNVDIFSGIVFLFFGIALFFRKKEEFTG